MSKGLVPELSLVFCASGAAYVQLEPMSVRCQERARAFAAQWCDLVFRDVWLPC